MRKNNSRGPVKNMLMVLKLFPKGDQNKVWDCILNNLDRTGENKLAPIQITEHMGDNVVGILFNVENIDDMVNFLTYRIGECEEIIDTQTMIFMKPVFLPLPKDRTKRMRRFTIPLTVQPKYFDNVYKELIDFKYPEKIFPIYITYTLGECDILLSIVAEDLESIHNFVSHNISTMNGVDSYKITEFGRSKRLLEKDKWRTLQRSMLHIPSWAAGELQDKYLYDYDLSPPDDAFAMSGAMVDEL
jgi:DNA-binding Lrp family transcriptional regulator